MPIERQGATLADMRVSARVSVLVTPQEKNQLFVDAKRAGYNSVSEYLRSKAFDRDSAGLDALLDQVHRSVRQATEALDRILAQMTRPAQEEVAHTAAIRAAAAREWEAMTPDQQLGLTRLLATTAP